MSTKNVNLTFFDYDLLIMIYDYDLHGAIFECSRFLAGVLHWPHSSGSLCRVALGWLGRRVTVMDRVGPSGSRAWQGRAWQGSEPKSARAGRARGPFSFFDSELPLFSLF